jgi:hypothetical protein
MKALEHGGARVSRLDATRRKRRRQHRQQSNGIRRRSAAGMRSGRPAALSLRQRQRPLTMKPTRVETCLGTSMGECARTFCSRLVGAASTTSSTLRRAGQLDANSTLRQQVRSLRGRRGLHASSGCAPRGSVTSQIETSKTPKFRAEERRALQVLLDGEAVQGPARCPAEISACCRRRDWLATNVYSSCGTCEHCMLRSQAERKRKPIGGMAPCRIKLARHGFTNTEQDIIRDQLVQY